MERKDRIMMSLHDEKNGNEIKAIAMVWLNIDDCLMAIRKKLSLTDNNRKIQELEELVWKK